MVIDTSDLVVKPRESLFTQHKNQAESKQQRPLILRLERQKGEKYQNHWSELIPLEDMIITE